MDDFRRVGTATLRVLRADITSLAVDALVNAANEHLAHGGGVAAALARAGGPQVQQESDAWVAEHGLLGAGDTAVTTAGSMPARMIIHVVGPRYRDGQNNAALLADAVRAALDAAEAQRARSVGLPAISAGIFGYPPAAATRVIAGACARWLSQVPRTVSDVVLVGFDDQTAELFRAALHLSHDVPDG